jgi:membrane protein required for colicin V production
MPSYLDLGFLAVVLISALLAMLRGLTREVMAILSWGVAAAAAIYFYPLVVPYLADPNSPVFLAKDAIRPYAAGAAVFFAVLILVSLITIRLSNAILDSKIGALDRSLGFVFGAARGLLLCAIAFIFFNWLAPEASTAANAANDPNAPKNPWFANSKSLPLLKSTGQQLLALLPDDPDGLLAKLKKQKPGDEASPPDSDEPKSAPATPSPPVRPRAEAPKTESTKPAATATEDKRKLDSLLKNPR